MSSSWAWLHRLGSPKRFYNLAGTFSILFGWASLVFALAGLYFGLLDSPVDYQQGNTVRIMYVHVPSAWNSIYIYLTMAAAAIVGIVWKIKAAHAFAVASAPIGASFTFLALATGAIWGKPMWGTWWVWDARLTSELILLFLYLGYMALYSAIEDRDKAARAAGILVIVGVVNIPIIYYSVEWWNTLHQGSTVNIMGDSSIDDAMLIPLLLMAVSFKFFYFSTALRRARCEVLDRERNSKWVQELVEEGTVR